MKFINKRKIITIKINHPGHNEVLLYFDKHSVAATPPSKANLSSHLQISKMLKGDRDPSLRIGMTGI